MLHRASAAYGSSSSFPFLTRGGREPTVRCVLHEEHEHDLDVFGRPCSQPASEGAANRTSSKIVTSSRPDRHLAMGCLETWLSGEVGKGVHAPRAKLGPSWAY